MFSLLLGDIEEQFQITLETYFPFPCSCWLKADWMPKIDWIHFTQLLEEEEGGLNSPTQAPMALW
jgi:hypothetical protein